jgi:hypothetical protein
MQFVMQSPAMPDKIRGVGKRIEARGFQAQAE